MAARHLVPTVALLGGLACGAAGERPPAGKPTALTLAILDSFERVEYAAAEDFKTSAVVKLSRGEPVGYVVRLANDTEMPSGSFTRLYKMVPVKVTTPSYSGGRTGIFYDALVPLLTANLSGTTYVYAEYIAPQEAGTQAVRLTQGGQSITLNAEVAGNTLTPNPVPLYVGVYNSFLTLGHYGRYVGGSENLGIPYLREAVAHRITPYGSEVTGPPMVNGLLDYDSGGNFSFQRNVLDFVPQGFAMPNYSDPATLRAADATVRAKGQSAWFYTRDEPGGSDVTETNAHIATQRQYAPSIRTMVTTDTDSGITPDVFCPVIDNFGVRASPGGPIGVDESAYAGKELWLYTSCMEHGCGTDRNGNPGAAKVSGSSTGAPGFSLDRPASYIYAFVAMPLRYRSVKGLLYYNSIEGYKLYPKGVDVWADPFNFGGNGDGTLFYPLRVGLHGSAVEQPAVSIRMKKIRDAQYLMDYAAQGSAFLPECGAAALIRDSLDWEKDASKYKEFRECLISRLGL